MSVSVAQQRTWKGERQPETGALSTEVGHLLHAINHAIAQVSPFLNSLMTPCLLVYSNVSEETKQQNSELSEQLKLSNEEKGALKFEVEDFRKRLELADLMLQQVQ